MVFIILPGFLNACGKKDKEEKEENDPLVVINGREIFSSEIEDLIPSGLSDSDSLALYKKILDSKIRHEIIKNVAEENIPDMEAIERRVAEYREKLIILEYLMRKRDSEEIGISQEDIKNFYEEHKNELLTGSPLVKGIYIKMPVNSKKLERVKELLNRNDEKSIDILESECIDDSYQYEYFKDKWVDMNMISDKMPLKIDNSENLIKSNKLYESTGNGSAYLLYVTDVIPEGVTEPFDYASDRISYFLREQMLEKYEEELISSLIKKAVKEKKLVGVTYDPLTGNNRDSRK